jgi:Uma2 family endonuclease
MQSSPCGGPATAPGPLHGEQAIVSEICTRHEGRNNREGATTMAQMQPHDRLFTVDEYYKMAEAGIIGRDERVELIAGRIVTTGPIGSPHAWCVNRLADVLSQVRTRAFIGVQNPVRLDSNGVPEPDIAVIRRDAPDDRHPAPADVLLIVEVADTSLTYDRHTKVPLYARAGIPETWIADLNGERIEVHREPSPDGYRLVRAYGRGERISPLFAPDLVVEVDEVLGPPASGA